MTGWHGVGPYRAVVSGMVGGGLGCTRGGGWGGVCLLRHEVGRKEAWYGQQRMAVVHNEIQNAGKRTQMERKRGASATPPTVLGI